MREGATMMKVLFYDGATNPNAHARRLRVFGGVTLEADFRAQQDETTLVTYLTSCLSGPAVLFCHITQCQSLPERLQELEALKRNGVVVFFSGDWMRSADVQRIVNGRKQARMEGRVFVHRPPFDGPNAAIARNTRENVIKFVKDLGERVAGNADLQHARFRADEFGWAGIAEEEHLEQALAVLHACLPLCYGNTSASDAETMASKHWEELERIKSNAVQGAVGALKQSLEECWRTAVEAYGRAKTSSGDAALVSVRELRDQLLGADAGESEGLVHLIAQVWYGTSL